MEIEKKHILKSYKNEQEAIEAVEKIKAEKENPINSSISGYNFEKPKDEKFPTNPFQPGKIDLELREEDNGIEFGGENENPDVLANDSNDIDRPLAERAMHTRIR
jgi:hypothetical protein